ncbi:hypothetical protein [uncultured Mucilaginibacter sp.]|uniref:hypothetical protein n=1 Tax=uncultured Mucilaginibacter sp. TaxID=797541 RepID=UPI0025CED97E|nr:hypothetical protein [uncultured Mucilaginibacter sp.]
MNHEPLTYSLKDVKSSLYIYYGQNKRPILAEEKGNRFKSSNGFEPIRYGKGRRK